MATHGTVDEFIPRREDWVSYTECLEQYFTADAIKQEEEDRWHARKKLLTAGSPQKIGLRS